MHSRHRFFFLLLARKMQQKRKERVPKRQCSSSYCEKVVPQYSESEFLEDFRVSRSVFAWLCEELSPELAMDIRRRGAPLSVANQLAIALWRWATGSSLRVIARMFAVGRTTVHTVCDRVASAIIKRLYKKIVRFPAHDDRKAWREISEGFQRKRGIKHVAGAIDGTHFGIKKPKGDELHNAYINRKGYASIACQAVVDSEGIFRDVSFNRISNIVSYNF